MISKSDLIKELLALVDSSPLTDVNVRDILETHSNGLDFKSQQNLRNNLDEVLILLKNSGDIEYNNCNFSVSVGCEFVNNSGLIKSTINRVQKLEQIERDKLKSQPTHQATFNAPFAGNFNQGSGSPQQQLNEPKKSEKPKWLTLTFYWEEAIKLGWKAVILAIVALLLTYLGFRSSTDKESDKYPQHQEQNQITVQSDTTNKKDSVAQ
jgi:hypothetical protein